MKLFKLALIIIVFSMTILSSIANAEKPLPVAVSAPSMTLMLEPYAPDGTLRQYSITGGSSYWTTDLPVYTSDKVKVDIFVATGANDLQKLKVRLDNQLISDAAQAPWVTTFDASKIGPGYHFIEAWAQVSGVKPSLPQFVTHTMMFFIAAPPATVSSPPVQQPVVEVKGQQQILSGNTVTNVPLGAPDPPTAAPQPPALPQAIAGATLDPNAKVSVHLEDPATGSALPEVTGIGYHLATPALAVVVPAAGSGIHKFVYSIVSQSSPVVSDDTPYSTSFTRVRLQPETATTPGLLPGTVYVWVWGITDAGKYSQPACAMVDVAQTQ